MKITMLKKTYVSHKLLLVTELFFFFCSDPKAMGKKNLFFVERARVMLNYGLAYKNTSSLQLSIAV